MFSQNVTGWFLLLGKANERFIYTVRKIRDGGYCTRGVDVVQESTQDVCFTCICSFKSTYAFQTSCTNEVLNVIEMTGPERDLLKKIDVRHDIDLQKTFEAALGNMRPEEHEEMPGVDAPWYV